MKAWGAAILLVGRLLPGTMAATVDHTHTVVCIPDNHVDTVLSYYVNSDEHPFCMNGGTCKQDFEQQRDFPCDCPAGLTGPHCEFEEGSIIPECSMECFNGGTCQAGAKLHTKVQSGQSPYDLEYCICPEGYCKFKVAATATFDSETSLRKF